MVLDLNAGSYVTYFCLPFKLLEIVTVDPVSDAVEGYLL